MYGTYWQYLQYVNMQAEMPSTLGSITNTDAIVNA